MEKEEENKNMKHGKIITLTLNPAFDVHCHVAHFAPYHENLATVTLREAGGKGVNISRALTKNGVENLALVVLGEENADSFRRALSEDGMCWQEVVVSGRIRENMTLHTEGADETRISFEGFAADATLLERVMGMLDTVDLEDCFVTFTGRVPAGIDMEDVKRFLRALQAKGARIVIDSKSFSTADLIECRPYLIKPNEEEIAVYLEREIRTFADVYDAAVQLQRAGIENVMVSLGSKGAMLVCDEGGFVATPPAIEALSTIGAGDSSIAGFLAAAREGRDARACLCRAVAFGSAACMTPGTQPPLPADVDVLIERITVCKSPFEV